MSHPRIFRIMWIFRAGECECRICQWPFCYATEFIILATAGIGHSPGWTRRGCRWTATSSWPATVAGNRKFRKWRSRSRSCWCWRRRWSGKRGFPSWRPSALTRCCQNFPSGCLKFLIKNLKYGFIILQTFFSLIAPPGWVERKISILCISSIATM